MCVCVCSMYMYSEYMYVLYGQMEVGGGLGHNTQHTRPADVLVPIWVLTKPAAFDITVESPPTPITLHEASVTSGSTAQVAENRKHASNGARSLGAFGNRGLWLLGT